MVGQALRATLPARYPSALTPMRGTKLLGTLGSSATVAGSCARVAATNPMTPMIVHTKNCSRSGARTPPLVTKSPRDGWGGPAPLAPPNLGCPESQRGGADTDAEEGRQSLGHIRQLPSPLDQTL